MMIYLGVNRWFGRRWHIEKGRFWHGEDGWILDRKCLLFGFMFSDPSMLSILWTPWMDTKKSTLTAPDVNTPTHATRIYKDKMTLLSVFTFHVGQVLTILEMTCTYTGQAARSPLYQCQDPELTEEKVESMHLRSHWFWIWATLRHRWGCGGNLRGFKKCVTG